MRVQVKQGAIVMIVETTRKIYNYMNNEVISEGGV